MPNWTTDFDNAEQAEDYAVYAYRLEQKAEKKAVFLTLEDCVLSWEREAEQAHTAILNDGGAGSSEAMAAHAEWMIARTQRVTMDALDDWRRWGYV